MTICIGAINSGGSCVILASDSMITNSYLSIEFEHHTNKMTKLSDTCIALTAGDALAHTELFKDVQRNIYQLKNPSFEDIKEKVKDCYQSIRQRVIKERYLKPRGFDSLQEFYEHHRHIYGDIVMGIQGQIDSYDYELEILLAGVSNGEAHLYGIVNPGTSHCFDSIGFYAIGSGLPHALNSLIARGCHEDNSLEECLLNTLEAKIMAEKAPGVGSKVTNICMIDDSGITNLSEPQISRLRELIWKRFKGEDGWEQEITELIKEGENA
ncbi:MAG: hypothetical protein ACRENZ_03295 [Thermodesulfobacteriota bacterium]